MRSTEAFLRSATQHYGSEIELNDLKVEDLMRRANTGFDVEALKRINEVG